MVLYIKNSLGPEQEVFKEVRFYLEMFYLMLRNEYTSSLSHFPFVLSDLPLIFKSIIMILICHYEKMCFPIMESSFL